MPQSLGCSFVSAVTLREWQKHIRSTESLSLLHFSKLSLHPLPYHPLSRACVRTHTPLRFTLIFFFNRLFFRIVLGSEQNGKESTASPTPSLAFPIVTIPSLRGAFVILHGPTLPRHYHPMSMLYIRVYSWCCDCVGVTHALVSCYVATRTVPYRRLALPGTPSVLGLFVPLGFLISH